MARWRADPISRTSAKYFLIIGLLAGGGGALFWRWSAEPSPTPPERPRRVLLITIDTLRADALGAYGRRQAQTPWIDRLAAAGVRFDRARAHNVVTLPSHANILSGRYPFDHGIRDNAGFRFPSSLPTLATLLKGHGYRTAAFVSAFPLDSRFGLDRGFDPYDDAFVGAEAQHAFLVQERSGQETVARARRWLNAQGDAPALCWVHLYEPHFPYEPPEPLGSRFLDNPYDGEVAASDLALGPLLQPILAEGVRGRTLVVLTSDHGESLGEHGEATHGIFAYEASLRVPLILYHPASWKPAATSDPARHVDILPTILDALGIAAPIDLPGRVLLPPVERRTTADPSYFEAMTGTLSRGWAPLRGFVRDEVKFIDLPVPELYDLQADPRETRNRARAESGRIESWRTDVERLGAGDPATPASESRDTRERLRSLGYLAGGGVRPRGRRYTEADDPKHLIALDTLLQEVVGRYLDGDLAGALNRCRDLVRRRPAMPVSLLYLAHLERESGHIEKGIEALSRAAALNGNDPETLALLGAYLTEAGRPRAAVERLEPLATGEPPEIDVLVSYALALARIGRFDAAFAALDRAQRVDPTNAMLHVHQGTVALTADDRHRARQRFEAAVSLSPETARAHSSLGVLAAEDGDAATAIEHWNRAVAADVREYRTILGVGANLLRRGHREAARPFLEFVVTNAPAAYESERQEATRLLGVIARR